MAYIGSKCKKKNTSIERKIQKLLMDLCLNFESNYVESGFSFDILLKDYNIIIECQGDYWHRNPKPFGHKPINEIQAKNIARDNRKIKYLNDSKYQYLFFWESDIHNNFEKVTTDIKNAICQSV
jgi:G:T-mismatch repair DNA endonuclease (very short patch repair protein)